MRMCWPRQSGNWVLLVSDVIWRHADTVNVVAQRDVVGSLLSQYAHWFVAMNYLSCIVGYLLG